MFEELIFMGLFLLFSIVVSYLLFKYIPSPLDKLVKALAIIGIIIHELCHVVMCIVTHAPISHIKLLEKVETDDREKVHKFNYRGRVVVGGKKSLTFLQALLIGLAPLLISFWIFFLLLDLLFTTDLHVALFFLFVFVMISIVLAAAPSSADLLTIPSAFQEDPKHSLYQIFLLFLSIITVWVLIISYQLLFFHEIITYFLIGVVYYAIKYCFIGINKLLHTEIHTKKRNYRALTRRRFKPMKPSKLGIEEPHW